MTALEMYWPKLCADLMLENLQLRAALGQSVPSWVPEGSIRCGMCEARRSLDAASKTSKPTNQRPLDKYT